MNFVRILTVTTIVLFLFDIAFSQSTSDAINHSKITISSSAEVAVPADIVYMQININMNHQDADRAFQEHKEREEYLANLLMDLDFDSDQISYQPIQMRPNRQRDGSLQVHTNQTVHVTFYSIDQFGDVQSKLIANGFDNFSGSFGATESEEAGKIALSEAVKNARAEAEILAESAGMKVGEVLSIEHTTNHTRPVAMRSDMLMRASSESASLSDFSQTITVKKSVTVQYRLVH